MRAWARVPLGWSLLAFVGTGACATGIDPAAKEDIDRRVARLSAPAQTFPAPAAPVPLPLAAGQWAQYQMIDDQGRPSFFTLKVVGEDLGAHWLEILEETYSGRRVSKMLLYIGDRTSATAMDIRALRSRIGSGPIQEATTPAELTEARATWQGVLLALVASWQGLPQEEARAPAGIFAGSYRRESEPGWGPLASKSTTWSHPTVPLWGLVKSEGIERKNRLVLVAFGEHGALGELP
jgi:hypothetical protein